VRFTDPALEVVPCIEIFTQALRPRLANVEPSMDHSDRRNLGNRELLGKDLRRVLLQWVRDPINMNCGEPGRQRYQALMARTAARRNGRL
jgi:hypothetical protein